MRGGCLLLIVTVFAAASFTGSRDSAAGLPAADKIAPQKLLEVDHYCEGVVFDADGRGYISQGRVIVQFTPDGRSSVWAETGSPNGHKILADRSHLVCDASQHAVLRLNADGKLLAPASTHCDGKPLRGPNDLTLDTPHRGFYFTDPDSSDVEHPTGTVHYVDAAGTTHQADSGLAFPNGIVLDCRHDGSDAATWRKANIIACQSTTCSRLASLGRAACWPTCRRKTPRPVKSTISPTACAWTRPAIYTWLTTE